MSVSLPNQICVGCAAYLLANLKLDQQVNRRSWVSYQVGTRPRLVSGGMHEYRVLVRQVCEGMRICW